MTPEAIENAIRAIQNTRNRMKQRETAHEEVIERKDRIVKKILQELEMNRQNHQSAVQMSRESKLGRNGGY